MAGRVQSAKAKRKPQRTRGTRRNEVWTTSKADVVLWEHSFAARLRLRSTDECVRRHMDIANMGVVYGHLLCFEEQR